MVQVWKWMPDTVQSYTPLKCIDTSGNNILIPGIRRASTMFSRYFKDAEKKFITQFKPLPAKKGTVRKSSVKYDDFAAFIESVLPESLGIAHAVVRDCSGYTSDAADFLVFKPVARATNMMFRSILPTELVSGAFHMVQALDRKTLLESLVRSAQIKKCDRYEGREDEPGFIASFVVAFQFGLLTS